MSEPTQKRLLVTGIPGPRSIELHERRSRHVSDALGATLPIFVDNAGGGILVDVDGNHLIDIMVGEANLIDGHALGLHERDAALHQAVGVADLGTALERAVHERGMQIVIPGGRRLGDHGPTVLPDGVGRLRSHLTLRHLAPDSGH